MMETNLTAQELSQALEGVQLEAVDKYTRFKPEVGGWFGFLGEEVSMPTACFIHEAHMTRWLHSEGFMVTTYQDAKVGIVIIQPALNAPRGPVRPFQARTVVEALAAACRSLKGDGD